MPLIRLLRIIWEAARFAVGLAIGQFSPSRSRLRSPQRLSVALARLGPSFIKFGQALSMHNELLPDSYIKELQSLQEHIAPFPAEDAIREIEEGLGATHKTAVCAIRSQALGCRFYNAGPYSLFA